VLSVGALSALAAALHRFDPPWIKVGRLYRRIFFLRSEGHAEQARRIEDTELAEATALARRHAGSEIEAESILQQLIADEKERVADAIAFAEVLVPMLADRLGGPAARPAPSAAAPARPRLAPAVEPRGIADFIDDMLTQERRASS
jgi:hypothetical protein